jgi:hypothetical protein
MKKLLLIVFLLVICVFHKQIREGFELQMNNTLSKMVITRGLEIDTQTLPFNAICAKTTGKSQCKPPYECKTASPLQYGNCL